MSYDGCFREGNDAFDYLADAFDYLADVFDSLLTSYFLPLRQPFTTKNSSETTRLF